MNSDRCFLGDYPTSTHSRFLSMRSAFWHLLLHLDLSALKKYFLTLSVQALIIASLLPFL